VLRSVIVSAFVSAGLYVRLRADTRVRHRLRQFVRQLLTVRLLGGDRTPVAPADLHRATCLGVLGQVAVQRRAAHAGDAHQLADSGALGGRHAQGEPERFCGVGRAVAGRFLLVRLVRVGAAFVPAFARLARGMDRGSDTSSSSGRMLAWRAAVSVTSWSVTR